MHAGIPAQHLRIVLVLDPYAQCNERCPAALTFARLEPRLRASRPRRSVVGSISRGADAGIRVASLANRDFAGQVTFVGSAIDPADRVKIAAVAHFSDGTRRDVTARPFSEHVPEIE